MLLDSGRNAEQQRKTKEIPQNFLCDDIEKQGVVGGGEIHQQCVWGRGGGKSVGGVPRGRVIPYDTGHRRTRMYSS